MRRYAMQKKREMLVKWLKAWKDAEKCLDT